MAERPNPDTATQARAIERIRRGDPLVADLCEEASRLEDMLTAARGDYERMTDIAAELMAERDAALARLAAITAAIDTADGAQFARLDAERTKGEWVHRDVTQFVAGWDEATARLAASLTPTPTPDHDGHTIDVGPVTVHDDRCPTCGSDDREVCNTDGERHTPVDWDFCCPDAWHNGGGAT